MKVLPPAAGALPAWVAPLRYRRHHYGPIAAKKAVKRVEG